MTSAVATPTQRTGIRWTNATWNPTTGCSKVSAGCKFCYAETLSLMRGWSKLPWTPANAAANVVLHEDRLRAPYKWREPSRVFVNSMSDLFHERVPDDFIARVFDVMSDTPQHTYQILTKRPERAAAWAGPWRANIWMGTSVENEAVMHRIDALRPCAAQTLFLSCEPLLGPLSNIDLHRIAWVIAGGESGFHLREPRFKRRWMRMEWARELRDACVEAGVAFFFKQDSGARTELRPWLVEEDGSRWRYEQFPNEPLAAPVRVE
jgi:protein gp37